MNAARSSVMIDFFMFEWIRRIVGYISSNRNPVG